MLKIKIGLILDSYKDQDEDVEDVYEVEDGEYKFINIDC